MSTSKDAARRAREERMLLQSESRWLQKALFALGKAVDARRKLGDLQDAPLEPFSVPADGGRVDIDALRDAVGERVGVLQGALKEQYATLR